MLFINFSIHENNTVLIIKFILCLLILALFILNFLNSIKIMDFQSIIQNILKKTTKIMGFNQDF